MLHLREYKDNWDLVDIPLFLDPDTGKEVTLASSKWMLAGRVKKARLSPQNVNDHSLGKGGANAYENSPKVHYGRFPWTLVVRSKIGLHSCLQTPFRAR